MNSGSRWVWLVIAAPCCGLAFIGCGSGGDGGGGGDDAQAGAGTGGSGKGGSAGSTNRGGSGGKGGSAGTSSGASGGDGEAGMPSGGTAGTAGSGNGAHTCQEACENDADCLADHTCQDSRCVPDSTEPSCMQDEQCVAQASGWVTECEAQADCLLPDTSCVDIGDGVGRCAPEADGSVSCATLQQDEVSMPLIEGGGNVDVCGNSLARCDDGTCMVSCDEDSCPENFVCNETTGRCECDNDQACAGVPNTSVCVDGRCQCASDGDCTENANVCTSGTCGCGDDSICTDATAHPGTSWVCE